MVLFLRNHRGRVLRSFAARSHRTDATDNKMTSVHAKAQPFLHGQLSSEILSQALTSSANAL